MTIKKDKYSPAKKKKALWMRGVPFVALRDLLAIVAEHPEGVRAKEIEIINKQNHRLRTAEGRLPSNTTLYHYRNILLHLGVLVREKQKYYVNRDNPTVEALLNVLSPGTTPLNTEERRCFAMLVVANEDCRRNFFDLFIPEKSWYSLDHFIQHGQRVSWKRPDLWNGGGILLRNLDQSGVERRLLSEDEIQAILYGLRYWARNELGFIDELFLEDLGGVMFPVHLESPIPEPNIVKALLESLSEKRDWTKISVREFILRWGPYYHVSLSTIFKTLRIMIRSYPDYIVPIPTSEAFATITAGTTHAEKYQLRSYLQDESKRYISHIRIHQKLLEEFEWTTVTHA